MRGALLASIGAVVALAGGGALAPAALAAVPVGGAGWSATVQQYRSQPGAQYDYVCPAGGSFGSVWGTGIFTDDSSVCTAAVHQAGISQAAGGTVRIVVRGGEASYTGTTANGVTTRGYGAFGGSFSFVGMWPASGAKLAGYGWDASVKAYRGDAGGRYQVICPAGGSSTRIWGATTYTDDSSVCAAGIQTGAIAAASGGTVTVELRAGLSAYRGATANGIRSQDYGAWGGSFVVVGGKAVAGATATRPATPSAGGSAPAGIGGTTWGSDTRSYRARLGSTYAFLCPARGASSTVWGSGPYTDDSSVCTAAVHAGLITFAGGGRVIVRITAGLASYAGSARNGVTTRSWGAWHGSFVIVGATPGGAAATTTAAGAAVSGTVDASWGSDARPYRSQSDTTWRYTCPAGGGASAVWGSDTYTDDSSVCTAAVHAGLISFAGGGTVVIRIAAGQPSYAGTARNGVSTRPYGPWGGSFVFVR